MGRSPAISIDKRSAQTTSLETVIAGKYRLADTGQTFPCPIRALQIDSDLSGQESDLIGAIGIGGRLAIVCDRNTADVLGHRLSKSLRQADLIVLDTPKADDGDVEELSDKTRHNDALIAVGAGTLNDLCKYVSYRRHDPYAVFPTAASMNGYATATASISRGGEKLSLQAAPPKGVFVDLNVLTKAPARLTRAGVGDSLCRSTAQIDWFLSHCLLNTAYSQAPFDLQQDAEQALICQAAKLLQGDHDAMRALVELLMLGGLGMLIVGNSQPGSQGEHLISHYIDMFCHPHPGTLHGEQVGLAAWTMARLQDVILKDPSPPILGETLIDAKSMKHRYGHLSPSLEEAMKAKAICGNRLEAINAKLRENWTILRQDLSAAALTPKALSRALDAVGVAKDPTTLGIDPNFYGNAVRHARELRDRFTMLDLADNAGRLEPFIEQHLDHSL